MAFTSFISHMVQIIPELELAISEEEEDFFISHMVQIIRELISTVYHLLSNFISHMVQIIQ